MLLWGPSGSRRRVSDPHSFIHHCSLQRLRAMRPACGEPATSRSAPLAAPFQRVGTSPCILYFYLYICDTFTCLAKCAALIFPLTVLASVEGRGCLRRSQFGGCHEQQPSCTACHAQHAVHALCALCRCGENGRSPHHPHSSFGCRASLLLLLPSSRLASASFLLPPASLGCPAFLCRGLRAACCLLLCLQF
jgi:hypothetical protein